MAKKPFSVKMTKDEITSELVEGHVFKDGSSKKWWGLGGPKSAESHHNALKDIVSLSSDPEEIRVLSDMGARERTFARRINELESNGTLPDWAKKELSELLAEQKKAITKARGKYESAWKEMNKALDNPIAELEKYIQATDKVITGIKEGMTEEAIKKLIGETQEFGFKLTGEGLIFETVNAEGKAVKEIVGKMVGDGDSKRLQIAEESISKVGQAFKKWQKFATKELEDASKSLSEAYKAVESRFGTMEKQVETLVERGGIKLEGTFSKAAAQVIDENAKTLIPAAEHATEGLSGWVCRNPLIAMGAAVVTTLIASNVYSALNRRSEPELGMGA